ncbi:hypothetical protein Ssi03_35610 [Sphaerisporangium siamense]|nr:hypothetical protein Ssi03_35610 [Sphaerisporangium siamense]
MDVDSEMKTGSPPLSVVTRTTLLPVDLAAHWNNRGISAADDRGSGGFNVWRNSFPAEYLPPRGARVEVAGVPFRFGGPSAAGDNVRCAGQYVELPEGRYDWIHLLTAAERRTEDTVALHFSGGEVDFESLRVSDFWAQAHAAFGEEKAYETPVMHYPHHTQPRVEALMWSQRVPVTRRAPLTGLRLPRNIAVHVFALTLQAAGEPAGDPA